LLMFLCLLICFKVTEKWPQPLHHVVLTSSVIVIPHTWCVSPKKYVGHLLYNGIL
jgi:hypothetical protein